VARKDLRRTATMMDQFFAAEDAAVNSVGTITDTIGRS
jgi:hypothetical protein